jgi:hypothetical protein
MGKTPAPGGILLDAVDDALAVDVGRHAVEDEVSDRVRHEVQLAVAVEIGNLVVDIFHRFLVGEDVELVELVLVLVELRRIEAGYPIDVEVRRLPGIVGNLIGPVGHAAHEGQAAGRIEHSGKIEKSLFLRRAVVDRFVGWCGIFYAEIVLQKAPGHEVLGLPDRAAIFRTCRDGAVAAAIDADAAGVVEGVGLGLDVQHACGAQAVLRRQRTGEQGKAADDAGIEDLAKGADAVGQHDAVDAVRQIGVLVADMQFAAGGRVLGDAGHLQQHLVQRRVAALWQRLDGLVVDLIRVGADGCEDFCARVVEFCVLARDHLRLGLRRLGGRLARFSGGHARLGTARRLHAPRRDDIDLRKRSAGISCRRRRLRLCRAAETVEQHQRSCSRGGQHVFCDY